MKPTDNFKTVIKAYLDQRAEDDVLFSFRYSVPKKNIDDCITYILNTVQKSGCNGFTDEEVFGMAVHYYDEDNIEVGKPINCHVVVNHMVELTEEEKKQVRQNAVQQLHNEVYTQMKQPKKKAKVAVVTNQLNLFDL